MLLKREFYPTPARLALQVWKPFMYKSRGYRRLLENENGYHVLEPSCGIGSLLLPVKKIKLDSLTCVEVDPELHTLLTDEYKEAMLGNFLEMDFSNHYINTIVMNPPFSNGDEHLLKAWDILTEGNLVCILNKETITNPYSQKRKLLSSIIQKNGSVENVGTPFIDSERTTAVETVIVRLHKKELAKKFNFCFDSSNESFNPKNKVEISLEDTLQKSSAISTKVRQVNMAIESFKEFLTAFDKVNFYLTGITDLRDVTNNFKNISFEDNGISSFQSFCLQAKKQAWENIFKLLMFDRLLTHGVRKEFQSLCAKMGSADFTEKNIMNFFSTIFENHTAIMDQAVLDVFDRLCKYDKLNSCHIEGWKTNDAFKINDRVILPYVIRYDKTFRTKFGWAWNYSCREFISDLDKVLCRFKGIDYSDISETTSSLYKAIDYSFSNSTCFESYFFEFKYFQKGTLHLKFKDKKLLQEFNLKVAKIRNWIPNDYDKKNI